MTDTTTAPNATTITNPGPEIVYEYPKFILWAYPKIHEQYKPLVKRCQALINEIPPRNDMYRPALVWDIDDTLIYGSTRGPIKPFVSLYRWVQHQRPDIANFIITARDPSYRRKTEAQLGFFKITNWVELYMVKWKTDHEKTRGKYRYRQEIENQGYTIVLNIGDDPGDHLWGGYQHSIKLPEL